MPIRRNRRAKPKKTMIKTLAKKVNRIVKLQRPERKHVLLEQASGIGPFPNPPTSIEVFPTASVWQINIVPQGTNGNERLGNRIMGSHMNLRYSLVNYLPAQVNHMYCRIMIVYDKRSNQLNLGNSAGALSDLMTQSPVNNQYLDANNQYNPEYRSRYIILHDKVHEIGRLTAANDSNPTYVRFQKRISTKLKTVYDTNTTTGLLGNIAEGSYYMIYKPVQTENLGVLVQCPQLHYSVDFFYTDA